MHRKKNSKLWLTPVLKAERRRVRPSVVWSSRSALDFSMAQRTLAVSLDRMPCWTGIDYRRPTGRSGKEFSCMHWNVQRDSAELRVQLIATDDSESLMVDLDTLQCNICQRCAWMLTTFCRKLSYLIVTNLFFYYSWLHLILTIPRSKIFISCAIPSFNMWPNTKNYFEGRQCLTGDLRQAFTVYRTFDI